MRWLKWRKVCTGSGLKRRGRRRILTKGLRSAVTRMAAGTVNTHFSANDHWVVNPHQHKICPTTLPGLSTSLGTRAFVLYSSFNFNQPDSTTTIMS